MGIRAWVLGLAVPLLVGLAGCGGEDGDSGVASAGGTAAKASASASLEPEDARLKFTQCMRQNGVDVPDPRPDQDSRLELRKDGNPEKVQSALEKCSHFLEAAGKNIGLDDSEVRDAMVKFAQCARQHGYDVPDPQPGKGIGALLDVDPETLKKVREVCGQHLQELQQGRGR